MIRRATLPAALLTGAALLAGPAPALAGQMLVQEPKLTLAGNFRNVASGGPTPGVFTVMHWQANPFTANGLDVPVTWMMGRMTGVFPPPPYSATQTGVANRVGATGAQIVGATIGAYLNSLDFSPTGTVQNLVSVIPTYTFAGAPVLPFAGGKTLIYAMQAQVPTVVVTPPATNPAYKGSGYIGMDITFKDSTHPATPPITQTIQAFAYPHPAAPEKVGFEPATGRVLVQTALDPASTYVTLPATSMPFQPEPWSGFRSLQAAITPANFAAVLAAIQASGTFLATLGLKPSDFSTRPADYSLFQFHINAEINYAGDTNPGTYAGGSVQMGYALRNVRVSLQDANDCTAKHNGVDGFVGLENGDPHFLCRKTVWHVCGSAARPWATTAATGTLVAPWQCNGSAWVPAP